MGARKNGRARGRHAPFIPSACYAGYWTKVLFREPQAHQDYNAYVKTKQKHRGDPNGGSVLNNKSKGEIASSSFTAKSVLPFFRLLSLRSTAWRGKLYRPTGVPRINHWEKTTALEIISKKKNVDTKLKYVNYLKYHSLVDEFLRALSTVSSRGSWDLLTLVFKTYHKLWPRYWPLQRRKKSNTR